MCEHEMPPIEEKQKALCEMLQQHPRMLIAYSGGVDSAFLLWFAIHRARIDAVGILADSPSLKRSERREALDFAQQHRLPVQVIETREMDDPDYQSNPLNRCFYCKHELFEKMEEEARSQHFPALAYGENADDLGDHRPGRQAAKKFQILSPLQACGLTKADIRQLAADAGLEVADKVAQPCLASRLPTGVPVDPEKLKRVEAAESFLSHLGFRIVRVRHHHDKARVEVAEEDVSRLLSDEVSERVRGHLLDLGFPDVELSASGYRGPSTL
jgi:uncharacterized protein